MESEPAKSAGGGPDAAAGSPSDETSQRQADRETIASTESSFHGLAPGTDKSFILSADAGAKFAPGESGQTLNLGQTFGRYQVRKILGSGSMGSVFLAHDTQLDREVALKVPRLERDSATELSQRLYREARAAATLSHPNICPVYDVSDVEGTCFIAMGYVSGQPLSAYIASKKRQPEREAAKVVRKIALALQEAHAQGILHRDLKPTNIMIDKRGEPIVMDFGVACWFEDQTKTRLTQQGAIVGTPAYMAPEQIEGQTKVGPAADIYSLGVLLFQILTGRCPFEGTVLNVISQVLHKATPDAAELRPDLSKELAAICNRAMQKNPEARFASMLDFAKALTAFLNGKTHTEKLRKDPAIAETIEFAKPKPERPQRPRPPAPLPARPRPTRKPVQRGKTQTNWAPMAIVGASVAGLLAVGALIGAMFVHSRPSPVVTPSTLAVASAEDPGSESDTAEPPVAKRPGASKKASTSSTGSSATVGASQPATGPQASTVAAKPSVPPETGNVSASQAAASPSTKSVLSPTVPLSVPEEAVVVQKETKDTAAPQPTGPAAAPGSTFAAPKQKPISPPGKVAITRASDPTARGASSPDRAESPDDDGPPMPRRRRTDRRSGQDPSDDAGPPPRRGGFRAIERGPTKGMSIEAYFKKADANGDGKLDPSEIPMHIIVRADTNKDGELSLHELQQAYRKKGKKLFSPPTPAEMRRMPREGPRPPRGGPDDFGPGDRPEGRGGQNGF